METITKKQIFKELVKIFDVYDMDITQCGFDLYISYKDGTSVNIKRNIFDRPMLYCGMPKAEDKNEKSNINL